MRNTTVGVTLAANMDVSQVLGAINSLKSGFNGLSMPKNLTSDMEKSFEKLTQLTKQFQQQLDKGISTKSDAKALAKTGAEIDKVFSNLKQQISDANAKEIMLKADVSKLNELESKLANLKSKLNESFTLKLQDSGTISLLDRFYAATNRAKTAQSMVGKAQVALLDKRDIGTYIAELDKLQAKIRTFKESTQKGMAAVITGQDVSTFQTGAQAITAIDEAIKKLKADGEGAKSAVKGMETDLAAAAKETSNFRTDALERGKQNMEGLGAAADHTAGQMRNLARAENESANAMLSMKDQVGQLQQSTQYFFGLRNMINLLKRGFREALDTVKELDAAMTETAVVTKFDVGDMWEKLPEYTANANALGATIQDMYKSATLYYQQGLNAEQAMSIASETMKMARIGGLEAADATDMMTAALRGFNMELSSESAQRINDVYSNLAAKTASNTQELGEAMERTASIAHSAGMSFEGTSAFLAQMIETTREAPENLGTAMKTIIARFQELKKNPLEMQEVDGEEVSFNKVDTALQTIGVTLRDTNGQFRELDQVFLDIAQRWKGLTQTQQRYIATTAAGSRQQSRFIAMMDNYDRTVQLMGYANDSAGASNEQFEKTMESMESKLAKLKNAWDLFTMGLADNDMLKGAVDGLTAFINGITTLIDKLSLGSSKLKSALTIFTAFMGLRMVGRGINTLLGGLGGMLDPNSTVKAGLKAGAVRTNDPSAIYSPIVKAIHQLQTAITQKPINNGQNTGPANFGLFKDSYGRLQSLIAQTGEKNTLSIGEAYGKINRLDDRQQASVLGQMPALTMALRKNGITFDSKTIKGPAETLVGDFTKQVNKGLANKTVDSQAVLKMFGSPQDFKQAMGAMGKEYAIAAEQFLYDGYDEAGVAERLKQQYLESGNDYTQEEAAKMAAKAAATTEKEAYANKRLAETFKTVIPEGAKLAQKFGDIGGKAMMAGQGISQLGMQLSNAGFEVAGQMVTDLGYKISSLGMAISGLGPVFAEVKTLVAGQGFFGGLGALFNAHPIIMTATAIITAITAISGAIKAVEKQAKDAGEEVRKSFEENYTKADEKISALTEYKDRFEELSKGVDEFGHNIGLSAEEYDEYLSISKELKNLSPSLIAGYNAEGEAIIKKGKAIQEVIDKLEDAKQEELNTFTSNTSVDKLIDEYQTSDAYKDNKEKGHTEMGDYVVDQRAFNSAASAIARVGDENLLQSINQLSGWNLDSLNQLTTTQLSWLSNHYNEVIGLVEEQNGTLEEEVREGYVDAFTNAGSAINEVMTEGQPIIDALQLWMGSEGLDVTGLELGEEFSNSFNEGLEGIFATGLSQGWEADEFKNKLREYSNEWKNLAGPTSEYTNILKDAQSVQNEYLDNIGSDSAIQDYNKNITDSCNKLIELANNTDTATAAGQAFQQQCIAQANALRTYATEGGKSLSEALNTAVDDISRAESALENFNEATKTDLSTAAEGMRSIYDKASETYKDSYGGEYAKHFEGSGDRTAWEAGRAILDEDILESIPDGEALQKRLKEWEPALREGEEGWYEFKEKIVNDEEIQKNLKALEDAGVKLDESGFLSHIPEDQWSNVAKAIGISEEMLTSMLNKGRQFADIDFANWGEVRHNLETSNSGIQGTIDTADDKGRRKLFVKESTYEAALADANYKPEEYEAKKQEGRDKQNLEYLKKASEYEAKELKNIFQGEMGFKNLNDLISGLVSTGDFSKDEIRDYAEGAGYKGMENFDTLYDSVAEAIDNPELYKQTSVLEKISGQIALLNDENTSADTAAKDRDKWAAEFYGKVGEAGKRIVDSEADYFARGKNADGSSNLSVEQYEATKKSLEAQQAWAEQQANMAEARAANASTAEEAAEWQAVADQWKQDAENIGTYLTMGAEAFAKAQQENQLVQDATQKAVDLSEQKASNEEIKTAMVESAQKMADAQMKPEEIAAAINQSYGTNLGKGDVNVDEKTGKVALNIEDESKLQEQLDNLTANIKGNITEITFNGAALASGQNNPNSVFHRYGTMARGSRKGYTISGRPTLTGEEGEELVWEPKRNQAYMVGSNGPQFANISKDAVVWNAEQTKRIKKNSKVGSVGTGARGIYHLGTMANGRFGTMAGGSGMTIPGMLDINAMANIQEVTPPTEEPTIPVKADLQVEGNKGGLLGKLSGNKGPSIDVTANIVSTNNTTPQTISVIGNITQLNNQATVDNINATATVTNVTKSGQVAGEPVSIKATAVVNKTTSGQSSTTTIKTKADNTAQQSINNIKSKGTVVIKTKADNIAQQAINAIKGKTVTIHIKPSFDGNWTKNATVHVNHAAQGQNNYIKHHTQPSFGSAAKGRYGMVGPKGKGGLTLTGEKGYEVAWLPNENRSMILGANGPQMLNLPRDAVIWTHEQSKKILKQQAIPAGSHAETDVKYRSTRYDKKGSGGTNSNSNSTAKTIQKTSKAVQKSAEDAGKAVGKVSVWWENIARKTEVSQRNMDKSQKAFENYIKEMRSTLKTTGQSLKSGGGGGNDYIKNIGKYIGYYQAQLNKANKELKTLNTGKGGTQKQMKANYGGAGHENIAQISYKSGKKSKEEYVNLAPYIKVENGTYVVDQKQLNKEKNAEKRKAIADAANKEINDRLSKKYKAEDEIEKANEALKKMGEELYETFFKWENELTKIWNITQKIEQAQSRMSRNDAYGDLLKAQLSTGKLKGGKGSAQKDLTNFRNKLKSQNQLLQNRQQAITESKKALQHLLTSDEEKAALAEVNSKLNKDNQATAKANKKAELDKAKQAKKNYDAAVKSRATAQSKLNSVNSKIAKLEKKRHKTSKEKKELKELKAQRTTYQNQIANYNKTISANKSLAGQVNKLQKEYNGMASGTALSATQRAGYEQYKKELENQIAAEDLGRKYTTITRRADGTIDVQFNTEAFEKARLNGDITSDMAKAVQDWVKKIQEASANLQENYENLIKDVTEYYSQLESLQDEWANYGKELTEITEDAEKQKIDKVKQLYDGVKKALDKLLDEVKRKLDERRKQEENAKTERDISQKQQRLAMLRADTSGGHQVEIAQLEQEIAEAQQNYQNSLEDQLVDKLQQQADLAAEQRERQIEIQEALATSVNNIEKVNEWMANPAAYEDEIRKAYYSKYNYDNVTNAEQAQIETDFNEFYNGLLTNQTKQEELIKQIDSIQSIVAEIEKALTLQNQTLETAKTNGYKIREAQSQFGASLSELRTKGKYTFKDFLDANYTKAQIREAGFGVNDFKANGITDLKTLKGAGFTAAQLKAAGYNNVKDLKNAGFNISQLKGAGFTAAQLKGANFTATDLIKAGFSSKDIKNAGYTAAQAKQAGLAASTLKAIGYTYAQAKTSGYTTKQLYDAGYSEAAKELWPYGKVSDVESKIKPGDTGNKVKALQFALNKILGTKLTINGKYDAATKTAVAAFEKKLYGHKGDLIVGPQDKAGFKKYGYKTGGLASFTGPAWLDGTPSKPELVLDARDTKNFIMLKDVLSKAMDSSSGLSGFGGAAYEININVDHINSDYDVDKIAKRVKENIVKDSGYRNVTQVRKFR